MKHLLKAAFVSVTLLLLPLPIVDTVADVRPKNEAERQILQFFSKWRNEESLPFSLPPLDVITIPSLNGSYSGKGVSISYSSSKLRLAGVNNFSVVKLDVSLSTLHASGVLSLPTLTIFADCYELKGKAFYVYSLKGSGKLDVSLKNAVLQFGIRLTRNGSGSRVVEMKLDFAIEHIQANLENSSWPINKLLNNEGVKILEGYHEEIITATRSKLVGTLDEYLADMTPAQLLDDIKTED